MLEIPQRNFLINYFYNLPLLKPAAGDSPFSSIFLTKEIFVSYLKLFKKYLKFFPISFLTN